MNKKITIICLAVLAAIVLTACGAAATPAPTAAPTQVPPTVAPPTAKPTVAPPTATAVPPTATEVPPTATPEYTIIKDNTGALQASVPSSWTEIDGSSMTGNYPSAAILVAPSLAKFADYTGPGAYIVASSTIAQIGGYVEILDAFRDSYGKDCTYDKRNDYKDSKYEGKYDLFSNCKSVDKEVYLILVVRPQADPTGHIIVLMINFPDATDKAIEQAQTLLDTFDVVGDLPK